MTREITSHKFNSLNDRIKIVTDDEPGPGGANHAYFITGFDTGLNPSRASCLNTHSLRVVFQNGPVPEVGPNGLTNEVLLAIVEDRLSRFQAGQYACRENALALTKVQEAMHWLHHRTRERLARGVEGTLEK